MQKLTETVNLEPKTEIAISIQNLDFAYPNQAQTLNNLNLDILPGEKVGLIGGNGAGKTTLFLLICGILSADSGEIIVVNQPVVTGEFRPEIGLVFQNPSDQLFCPSVQDDVAFGPENMGLAPAEVEKRVEEALATTGVLKLSDRVSYQLSGGEKCMVAIATVLAMRPQIILYDEPSANLDLGARRRLIEFLQQSSQTVVISSHDLELILEVCDRVVLLDRGKIIADGQPKEIMGDRELMETHSLERPHSLLPHPF
ncbi:MAG: ABC transporter ATP-binding protein, partial [Oscillatoria sp. PMC 1076.18]|nr:ABC transporter ATP-binding protein [Oscillatoria sp. PMC 1076.18]